ncbi:MAG TPA: hypothetical protein VHN80_10845, partial [Kineosporiaceae bacterium]|nr:hypothetical protein [Kineosporiaceae bacterium]
SLSPTPAPVGLEVGHSWVDTLDATDTVTREGSADTPLRGMERFVVYRIRVQVFNSSTSEIQLSPQLEAGMGADPTAWAAVPVVDPAPGQPFYVASDDGSGFRVRSMVIAPAALRLDAGPEPDYQPVPGVSSAGINPAPTIVLPGHTFTEVEFAVRATVSAGWTQTYAFRLRPAADTVEAGAPVVVTMGTKPPIVLTLPSSTTTTPAKPTAAAQPRYQLAMATTRAPAALAYPLAATVNPTSPHIEASLTSDTCAACHAAHRTSNGLLIVNVYRTDPLRSTGEPYSGADFELCITCHVESPFADTSGDPNPLTSFVGHGFHLGVISHAGTGGLDINVAGDGQGNALCAECHFNPHGVPTSERGLVRFAPDVEPFNGVTTFDAATQSCTLTCHGKEHDGLIFGAGN